MSFPRCALLWARLPAGRPASHRAALRAALRAPPRPSPGLRALAAASADSSAPPGGAKAPNTSLFVPLAVKPQGPSADGDVGAELTRPLDKSESAPVGRRVLTPGSHARAHAITRTHA